ncbi:MAG: AAA family ATPase, partial [bacterium]|nr:AAA family ATPase [bacterium]
METKRIKEIKNTDAFDGFHWLGDDLKKYNLIYGWNGSGKTTISRVFNFLERKEVHIHDLSAIEFTVQVDGGLIKQTGLATHTLNVRVFNEDFIEENLKFEQSQARKIVILGKENVAVQKEIEELGIQLLDKEKTITGFEEQLNRVPDLNAILTKAGSEVPQQFANTPLASGGYYGRSYNKTKVDKRLENEDVSESNITSLVLDATDFDTKKDVIKNEKKAISISATDIPDLSKMFAGANELLNTSITITEIEELKDDKDLRDWVEDGYKLHRDRKLNDCKFCKSGLPDGLLTHLGGYFTDELQKAKTQINSTVSSLGTQYAGAVLNLDGNTFFQDLARKFGTSKNDLSAQVKIIEGAITSLISQLNEKGGNLHDHSKKYSPVEYPTDAISKANIAIGKIKDIITEHNNKVATIADEVKKCAEAIELHIIAKTLSDREYFKHKKEDEHIRIEISKLMGERTAIDGQIKTKKASLQNATDAVDKINAILAEFFGSDYIHLEVSETASKEIEYVLKRRDKNARHL